ncbi:MAG: cytochrome C oxidase subunit IV family protein [Acidimicrobiia bacterium]|nr:cytochrome C oxidase subunit IV family protein [Acidimicrobiia bacterium]
MSDVETTEGTGSAVEQAEREPTPEPAAEAAPALLPGEIRPHPSPFQYVLIAVVLVVVTAIEVGLYYLEGDISDGLLVALLLVMALVKFVLVASWYMHLKTDIRFYRRVFALGGLAAIVLYLITLASLHVFD